LKRKLFKILSIFLFLKSVAIPAQTLEFRFIDDHYAQNKATELITNENELREMVNELEQLTAQLLKHFPQKKFHYVTIGQSLALAETFWEAVGVQFFVLPLSIGERLPSIKQLEEKNKGKLFSYMARYLPTVSELRGRELLVMDYFVTGTTLDRIVGIHKNITQRQKFDR
jgi:hypothetical protein